MPLYEYQCDACAHRFEQIRRFSDPPLESCPECGGAVRKLVSSPAIQFKGTGWYVTDYARQDRKEPSDAAEAKAGAPADGAASKSDEKGGKKKSDGKGGRQSGDSAGSSGSGSSASESAASSRADKPSTAAASS